MHQSLFQRGVSRGGARLPAGFQVNLVRPVSALTAVTLRQALQNQNPSPAVNFS